MLGAARALGATRTDLRLTRGDRSGRWLRLGLSSLAAVAAGSSVWIVLAARGADAGPVLAWLPVGLVFAAANAAQEELRFRIVPLSTLVPVVGGDTAVWTTAAVFGLTDWSGAIPSGPLGAIFHGLVGAWLAKSILETRGVAWAWTIHAAGNLALFTVLVLDAVLTRPLRRRWRRASRRRRSTGRSRARRPRRSTRPSAHRCRSNEPCGRAAGR